eukprot:CAMPEP_0206189552 /NCGR_PEP_ID=MMETSP0166-20121206/4234_1 /ASSEMBLY_ACC=CAM_ASM_000260 /TAXON_ID=95228 /ORGANISM="Vannella robusta, Strain DIVA3 518/3/11/1/6" /LENGTH=436 /DNA_ID=CAMNT_0053605485 /DNA_START=119 /DNA_END=1426 /DNA_ORIENTATION=-
MASWEVQEPKIVEVQSESDDEMLSDEEEDVNMPTMEDTKIDPESMSWPPRPSIPHLAHLYDKMKDFIIDDSRMELIFPPMDGEERKLVHTIAELFGLRNKSYGRKSSRHVRVYKYEDVPNSVEEYSAQKIAEGNTNARMKEIKIPMFIKESPTALREEVVAQTESGSKLLKRVVREGTGDSPCNGHQVYVHYEGYYEDGGVFDSTRLREQEFMFIVGEGQVIPGWDLAIATMKSGELIELITPPEYAFGPLGCPPRIPGGATLKYEIELIRFSLPLSSAAKSNELELPLDKSIECCKSSRFEGNALVSSNSFRKATKCYNRALNYFQRHRNLSESEEALVNECKLPIYSNLAFCYLKLKDYKRAKKSCEDALKIDNNHLKALCRMGESLIHLDELDEAKKHLLKAHSIDEKEGKVKALLKQIQTLQQKERERQQRM